MQFLSTTNNFTAVSQDAEDLTTPHSHRSNQNEPEVEVDNINVRNITVTVFTFTVEPPDPTAPFARPKRR